MSNLIAKRYEIIKTLGHGGMADVYLALDTILNREVAIKVLKSDMASDPVSLERFRREANASTKLSHPNIVELKDVVCEDNKLYLLFEHLDFDLKRYLDELGNENLNENVIKSFLYQILDGVAYCHSNKIIHRDLKPQNLLLDTLGRLKIADFGLARAFSIPIRPYTKEVRKLKYFILFLVTLWYRSPELLLGISEYSTPVDIWSVGCIFAELCLKRALFKGDYEIEQIFKIFSILGTPDKNIWPDIVNLPNFSNKFPKFQPQNLHDLIPNLDENGINLLYSMLAYDPNKRITAKQALLHVIYILFNLLFSLISPQELIDKVLSL